MLLFLKSNSRNVNENHHHHHKYKEEFMNNINDSCTSLTVWRKSLVYSCEGFTVIDSDGNLAYRVDNYTKRPDEVILMDGSGKPILTICRRKKLGFQDNWLIYEGEVTKSSKKPICCVRKHMNILQNTFNALAYVYHHRGRSAKKHAYVIEGSYAHRTCNVLDESRNVVAEIKKKKDIINGVSYGLEVFVLIVRNGFDSGFAMAIILLLDQMFS